MGHGTLAHAVFAVGVVAAAPLAHAQKPVEPGAIPAGFERTEIADLTFTMRDDGFSTIATDPFDARVAYVGTYQGRFYKTADRGRTWTESTIIPEQGRLWSTPGSTVFVGSVRGSADEGRSSLDLIGESSYPIDIGRVPSQLRRLLPPTAPRDVLAGESAISAGGGGGSLGVGLSDRSPRLSLYTASRGRPVPTLNRVKFLLDRSLRGTQILNLAVDPSDRRRIFAATVNGLYKSADGGDSWSRSFAGLTAGERTANRIAIRAGEPKLMLLGTTSGAYTSTDQGDTWSKLTTVGGIVNDVAFDPTDPRYIYLATNGNVLRSTDGGGSFNAIYASSFPAEADVKSIVIDPFDVGTAYIGTMRGAFVTRNLRDPNLVSWTPLEGVQSVLAVHGIGACAKHRGHLYARTRLELFTINYGAAGPESAIVESWDGGQTWRQLFTGQGNGLSETFIADSKDPDQLWIGWSTALHYLERVATTKVAPAQPRARDLGPPGPPIGEVLLAAIGYHGLEMLDYTKKIQLPKAWSFLPRKLDVTATYRQWSAGGIQDDAQFAASRYFQVLDAKEWRVMVWASWSLPDLVYSPQSVPMLRQRVTVLNDELRLRLMTTIHRSYGELVRLRALLATRPLDVRTEVIYRLRIEQLEAIVDLASGGYLTRWQKKKPRRTE